MTSESAFFDLVLWWALILGVITWLLNLKIGRRP